MSIAKRSNILVIMGSVRADRRCPQIAQWVLSNAHRSDQLACEVIDLRDWHLPLDDEPGIPAKGSYVHEHTRAWSAKVDSADGIVIVTPQYNWGYPAALKNALDHLYKEWAGKPLLIVTYGGHGGGKCAEQLRQVAGCLKMRLIETMPGIHLTHEEVQGNLPQAADELATFEAPLRQALDELGAMLAEAG